MTPEEKRQLNELLSWKASKERQQLSYPLDVNSEDALQDKGFLRFFDKSTSTVTADKSIRVVVGGITYSINVL